MQRRNVNRKNVTAVIAVVAVVISFLVAVKLLSQAVTNYYDGEMIVCLDAGHGGSDSGATSIDGKRLEKKDNFNLTLKVRDILVEKGVTVVLTREDDSEVSLKDRCRLANKKRCDLFVSLHRNSSAKGSGFEAWISQTEKNNEKKTAEKLLKKLSAVADQTNRGVKNGYRTSEANNYYINANTKMPSILLEVGFVTSEKDNELFDKNIDLYAEAIADVIYESVS